MFAKVGINGSMHCHDKEKVLISALRKKVTWAPATHPWFPLSWVVFQQEVHLHVFATILRVVHLLWLKVHRWYLTVLITWLFVSLTSTWQVNDTWRDLALNNIASQDAATLEMIAFNWVAFSRTSRGGRFLISHIQQGVSVWVDYTHCSSTELFAITCR